MFHIISHYFLIHLSQVLKILIFNASCLTTNLLSHISFFGLFANALAFFRKQQRLPNGIQKCFSSFFRSEAVFDLLSISVGVCPIAQRKSKRKKKNIKTISALMKNKKTQAFLKKEEKTSNELIYSNFQFAKFEFLILCTFVSLC